MYAIMGSVLTAGGLVAVMLLALLFRHPGAPRWAQGELTASLLAVVVTGILGVGLGYLATVPRQFVMQGASLAEIAALGGSLAVLLVVWRLMRPRLRSAAEPSPAAPEATVIGLTPPPVPPRTPRPRAGRPPRKAA